MLRLHLVFVGKTAFPELETALQRYLERLRHYVAVELHVVRPEKISSGGSDDTVRARESERILKLLGRQDYLIAWDLSGKQMDSPSFAQFLQRLSTEGLSNIWMAIGGPVGFSRALIDQAHMVLSLSKMTLQHDIARLVVLEQVYRAFTILKGEPYHR
jgi:23S rRNA (pseudouridine1915-N3)-methyltransferase